MLVGEDLAVALNDTQEAQQPLAYLATPESGAAWARDGSYVSLRVVPDPASCYSAGDYRIAELVADADVIRFDASDSMAPEIGSDLLWQLDTQWVGGSLAHADLADRIDPAVAAAGT